MTAYLTPDRFRTMRHGASLKGLSDLDLVELAEDATAIVDSYCNMPIGGSFLGGVIVGEQRKWRYPSFPVGEVGSRQLWPRLHPIVSVQGLRLVVGSEASANLPVNSLVIEKNRRFVEVTSASIVGSSGLFGVTGWVVPFGGLQQPIAEIDYTYGEAIPENDRLYPVGDAVNVFQAPHGHWVQDSDPPVVKDGSTLLTVTTDYTIDFEEGRVTLVSDPTGIVRAEYRHKLRREIPRAASLIMADLLGSSRLVAKGMSGLSRITAGEVTIERPRAVRGMALTLDITVPDAALMLTGFRYWSAA